MYWQHLGSNDQAALNAAEAFAMGKISADAVRASIRFLDRDPSSVELKFHQDAVHARNLLHGACHTGDMCWTMEMGIPSITLNPKHLRGVFGRDPSNPIQCDPSWRTSDVVALANGINNQRAFDRMPILADALQDAGCDNEELLNRCRHTPTEEFRRGEWALDIILGLTSAPTKPVTATLSIDEIRKQARERAEARGRPPGT